ncbi:hypothetical protein H5187_22610 [Pseudoalteromonas sp. SG44-1]|uniref:hypothetical protein n=1 Tax=Pseudoalteromonas sp. SG44-1 TaxID=2760964 RepID=UPI001602B234|nr:hypothetical protein [Pseudoalteromonas sp. SG44-1]MBB1420016.1 hypothetical protein [Pseudoalteromonas sp. SG44-1]
MDDFYIFLSMDKISKDNFINRGNKIYSSGYFNSLQDPDFKLAYANGTIDYIPYLPNKDSCPHSPSNFQLNITNNYTLEYNLELYRKQNMPHAPSRFSCIYAFDSYNECCTVATKFGWNLATVRKFRLMPNELNKVHNVNMEVVSLMRGLGYMSGLSTDELNKVFKHYWDGKDEITLQTPFHGTRSSGIIRECLIEGCLEMQDDL